MKFKSEFYIEKIGFHLTEGTLSKSKIIRLMLFIEISLGV
jgi:hypothetical protein